MVTECHDFGDITQNNGHCVVQCHSRSFKVTNFSTNGKPVCILCVNNSILAPALFPRYGGLLVQLSPSKRVPSFLKFNALVRVNLYIPEGEIRPQGSRNITISYGVKHISISSAV